MKTLGLIGGMSWESTSTYYSIINRRIREKLGGTHSSGCLIYSFDFNEIEKLQNNNSWDLLTEKLSYAAIKLYEAGAEGILICSNTMHKTADEISKNISIPLLHIVLIVSEEISKTGYSKIGLLGTKYTMNDELYFRIMKKNNIDLLVPGTEDQDEMHRIIFEELVKGILSKTSRKKVLRIIDHLSAGGAEGIILGCTEIPLLIKQKDTNLPLFDTTSIHALAAADWSIGIKDLSI